MTEAEIWNKITATLEHTLSKSEMNIWFSSTVLLAVSEDKALIEVPNKFVASWLKDKYIEQIQTSFQQNLNYIPEIQFVFKGSAAKCLTPLSRKRDAVIKNQLDHRLTLDNFVVSENNRLNLLIASEIAERPAENYNPVYFYSSSCSGKTHLLHAIGNLFLTKNPQARATFVSLNQLASSFSLAMKNQNIPGFRQDYQSADFFLIDDIHQTTGREDLQRELICIFNYYCQTKKQIVVAANTLPGMIPGLFPELQSRLEWGLLSELHVPDRKTRIKIIKNKADQSKLNIPDDVAFFLASFTENLKDLLLYLKDLADYTSGKNTKDMEISTVKSIIKKRLRFKGDITHIMKVVAEYFGVTVTDLLSNKKNQQFSYPRHVAMYLSRKLLGLPFKDIARAFGKKDHSTVIYAVKHVETEKNKKTVIEDIKKLKNHLL